MRLTSKLFQDFPPGPVRKVSRATVSETDSARLGILCFPLNLDNPTNQRCIEQKFHAHAVVLENLKH